MKLFAAKGKVEIQAQGDEMALAALKDVTITSTDGRLVLAAAKEVWIGAGGSYIRINAERIENGTPGDILEKCASWDKPGANSSSIPLPLLPVVEGDPGDQYFVLRSHKGNPIPNQRYRIRCGRRDAFEHDRRHRAAN
jgi:type VI secretion system secreted protein VgrG